MLALRVAAGPTTGTLAVAILALSAAFTDYSTGGLENPLTHAMLAVFLVAAFAPELRGGSVLPATIAASLVALSRPDAVLLVAPALAVIVYRARSVRPSVRLVLGALPLVAWGAFSVVYYGFPWPNTAYAKLGTGIPAGELALQGTRYLLESLRNDPLTLGATTVSVVLAARRGDAIERAVAAGIALYLVWVVKIGGDFMSGRFLTAPLFVAVALLARRRLGSRRAVTTMLAGVIAIGVVAPRATWRVGSRTAAGRPLAVDVHGIADERTVYLNSTGLAARLRSGREIDHPARIEALRVKSEGPAVVRLSTWGCGIYGYYAGPGIHIVDGWALGDAMLARLPAVRDLHWRIGHFTRVVPEGYLDTIATGRNQLRDADVAKFWDRLDPVIRAPLFAAERWKAILDFAFDRPAGVLDLDRWRLPGLVAVDAAPPTAGVVFGDSGVDIRFDPPSHAGKVEIGLEGGTAFLLDWRRESRVLASGRIELPKGLSRHATVAVDVPNGAGEGFDRMRVLPLRGDGLYRVTRISVPVPR